MEKRRLDERSDAKLVALCNSGTRDEAISAFESLYRRHRDAEPGHSIDVDIRYFHTLAYRDGWYSFVFPTVVGPRYNPPGFSDPILAQPRSRPAPGSAGTSVAYLRPEERSGHDIGITVELDAGVAIEAIKSSHMIDETRTGASTARIELASRTTIPNRDFVLDFKVAGGQVKTNLLTYADPDEPGEGYFTMMLYPPAELEQLRRRPMEMVFVLDCSGVPGTPIVRGLAGDVSLEFALPHDAGNERHAFLPKIWARLRIAEFADQQTQGDTYGDLTRAIRSTALKYGLMSDYTAFVAVDATQPTAGNFGVTVVQPVPMPPGVRYDTTVGN